MCDIKRSDYILYENEISKSNRCRKSTSKQEWTTKLKAVYIDGQDLLRLKEALSKAYMEYKCYQYYNTYTENLTTTAERQYELYRVWARISEETRVIDSALYSKFKEQFPNCRQPRSEFDYYLECSQIYKTHQLKGYTYSLLFDIPMVVDKPLDIVAPIKPSVEPPPEEHSSEPIRKPSNPVAIIPEGVDVFTYVFGNVPKCKFTPLNIPKKQHDFTRISLALLEEKRTNQELKKQCEELSKGQEPLAAET